MTTLWRAYEGANLWCLDVVNLVAQLHLKALKPKVVLSASKFGYGSKNEFLGVQMGRNILDFAIKMRQVIEEVISYSYYQCHQYNHHTIQVF